MIFYAKIGVRELVPQKGKEMADTKRKPGRPPGSKNKKNAVKTAPKAADREKRPMNPQVKDEICAVVVIAVGIFLAIAFQTHAAGAVGEILSDFFKGCFGFVAYILPYYMIAYGVLLLAKKMVHIGKLSVILLCVILLFMTFINSAKFINPDALGFSFADIGDYYHMGTRLEGGGLFGMYIGSLIVKCFGVPGLYIISIVAIIICLLLIINTPISRFVEKAKEGRAKRREQRAERQLGIAELEKKNKDAPILPGKSEPDERQLSIGDMKPEPEHKPETGVIEPENTEEVKKKRFGFLDKLKANNIEEPEPEPAVPENKRPDLSKLKITEGQRNILEYMYDDNLFGEKTETITGATGLNYSDFDVDSIDTSTDTGIDENENVDFSSHYEDFSFGREEEILPQEEEIFEEVEPADNEQISFAQGAGVIEIEPEKMTNSQAARATLDPKEINAASKPVKAYKFPPINLLQKGAAPRSKASVNSGLQAKAQKLEETLRNFNIDAQVVNVTQGPAVTRYEIHPNVGVKVKSIVSLADDIALNLEAKSIRIEAPIPGKAAVGIEVENDKINMVTIRDIIDTPEFKDAKSKITFAVGKDISGNAITADLKGAPHLLIAGSTGSGKSVCVNSIITSILYKAKPEEVKLVLIDPKVVELTNYNGIPHLLIPVVTEPPKAAAALNWAVAEMEDRYKKFAEEGVRELASYNNTVKRNGEDDKVLPQIVIIIDELADLMMAAPSQVEDSICRLAQKARAAGMHLIVATQRPSVDVITGVIKANIPSRIAFAVASQFDSRTILDMAGAEKLVGKGDMLLKIGGGKPVRVQGNFISDQEVNDVIEFVKSQGSEVEYADDVIQSIDKVGTPQAADDGDELLADAIETVVLAGNASASMLQRRFRIGYNRAARIIDMMEARGIIGPSEGSKPRQVLMTEEELRGLTEDTEDLGE